jgi:hypothetical protein
LIVKTYYSTITNPHNNLNINSENKMDNAVLKDIADYATKKLNAAYGYCGVAEGPTMAMLNSEDRKGNDIKIIIELKPE